MSERAAKVARHAAEKFSVHVLADHEQQLRLQGRAITTLMAEQQQLRADLGAMQREVPTPTLRARLRWLVGR